uniref:Uncharacterized protein n=1 Tax=viral metagenome TaxID=1070528 RepID=A0A6M3LA22_9ZZZZ
MISEDTNDLLKKSMQLHEKDVLEEKETTIQAGTQAVFVECDSWVNTKRPPISPMAILTLRGAEEDNKNRTLDYFLIFSTGSDKGSKFNRKKALKFVADLGLGKDDDFPSFLKQLVDERRCIQVDVEITIKGDNSYYNVTPIRLLGADEMKVEKELPF